MTSAMLWTGGKDSALALFRSLDARVDVKMLATFVPGDDGAFMAHPIEQMQRQAAELGLPHEVVPIREPYREGYVAGLRALNERHGVTSVITGDIDRVEGLPNWIAERASEAGIGVQLPLWQAPRESLLRELVARGIEAKVTFINDEALPSSWLGRTIDAAFIDDILDLSRAIGIDPCGENGEYHTMVTHFPPTPKR
jgi:diphthine-ammonia ligase